MPARSEAVVDEFEDGGLSCRDLPGNDREGPHVPLRSQDDPVVAADSDKAELAQAEAHDVASKSIGTGSKRSISSSSARSHSRVRSWRARSESLFSVRPTSAA